MCQSLPWFYLLVYFTLTDTTTRWDTSGITDQQIDDVLRDFIHRLMADNDDNEHIEEVLCGFIELMLKRIKIPELNDRFLTRMRVLIDAEKHMNQWTIRQRDLTLMLSVALYIRMQME